MAVLDIYSYFDYRKFLAAYYAKRKELEPWFSYRVFAKTAGFSSSGLYPNIVNGLRNISPRYLAGFIRALGLTKREAEYFRLMIDYTHCSSVEMRQEIFAAMSRYLPDRVRRVLHAQREFYSCWYHVVIYQALSIVDVKDDLSVLGNYLSPNPGIVKLKNALRVLEKINIIKRDSDGYYRPLHDNLLGGAEVGADLIRQFQNSLLDLGKTAHERFPKERRYQISETLGISAPLAERFRERIRDLHHEIVQQALQEPERGQVVLQFNLQMFPVSEVAE